MNPFLGSNRVGTPLGTDHSAFSFSVNALRSQALGFWDAPTHSLYQQYALIEHQKSWWEAGPQSPPGAANKGVVPIIDCIHNGPPGTQVVFLKLFHFIYVELELFTYNSSGLFQDFSQTFSLCSLKMGFISSICNNLTFLHCGKRWNHFPGINISLQLLLLLDSVKE